MKIPLAVSEYLRRVAKQPDVLMRNRFVEKNPVLAGEDGIMYVQRPALKRWTTPGDGPSRSVFHQPGAFDDDLFYAAYDTLYRIDGDANASTITSTLADPESGSPVNFACTGAVGTTLPYLFFADGQTLRMYTEDGPASGSLTGTAIANNDTVTIGGVVYKFTSGSVDAGTPAGTVGNPWLVKLGGTLIDSLDNLFAAINDTGTAGTDYSTAATEHPTVVASVVSVDTLIVRAKENGTGGNAIGTTESGANIAWGAVTLQNGGTANVTQVATPDDVGIIDLAFISGYVILIPAQGGIYNGRFYWIEPGATTIDPLNFATAERSADPTYQVVVFSDQFWLPGQNSTEVWYPTGDPDAPMIRAQGILFDRGTYPGSAIQVKDAMVITGFDGGVFKIKGGDERISPPDIEERIRKGFARQAALDALYSF